jgi:hypothetical protein
MASDTATVKRPPDIVSGKRGAPVLIADLELKVFPLMPLDPQVRATIPLDTPHQLLVTYTEGVDINLQEGDLLIIDSVEYPIKRIADWPYDDLQYFEIIVEKRMT